MSDRVKCNFWRPLKKTDKPICGGEGVCRANVLGFPTKAFCNNICPARTTKKDKLYVVGIDYSVKPTLIQKIHSYIKAEASMIMAGRLSDRIFKERMNVCKSCEHLVESFDDVGHCGACGCGMNSRASLTVKGRMPSAECIKGKWKK